MHSSQIGNTKPDAGTPTVARVAQDTIVELVYDADQRKTGLTVSRHGGLWNIEQEVRIHTGETLIPYSPSNNLIANDCVLLPVRPEHHGDKAELLADIEAFLHRYVDLSPLFAQIAAHYVLLTWVHDAFNELPYLRLRGDYGTGKTRGLLAIGSLCYRPFFASGAMPVARSKPGQTSYLGKIAAYREIIARRMHKTHWGIPNLLVLTVTTSEGRMQAMMAGLGDDTGGNAAMLFKAIAAADLTRPANHLLRKSWSQAALPPLQIDE